MESELYVLCRVCQLMIRRETFFNCTISEKDPLIDISHINNLLIFFFFANPCKWQQRCKVNEIYLRFTIRVGYPSDQLNPFTMHIFGLTKSRSNVQTNFQSETSKFSMDFDICRTRKVHKSTSIKHLLLICVMSTKKKKKDYQS